MCPSIERHLCVADESSVEHDEVREAYGRDTSSSISALVCSFSHSPTTWRQNGLSVVPEACRRIDER